MNEQLAQAIAELHKQHKGQTPAEAENHYLETCRELSMYGIFLFPAKQTESLFEDEDSKNDSVMIGVGAHGINIYKDGVRMHKFSWQNIIKISYRKNSFSIKLKPGELNQKETTVTYKLEDYLHAKRVWKCAVEHHTFFRLIQPEDKPHGSFLGLGSARFRYHGRTQFQTKMASQMFDRPASATIDRSHRLSQSLTDMAREPVHPLHYTDTELDKEQLSPAMSYTLKEHGGPEKRRKHQKTVVTTTKTTKTMEYTPEQVGASRFASASTHLSAHPSSSSHSHRIALSSSAYTPHVAVQTTEGHEGPDDDRLYYSPSTTIESPTGGSYYLSDDGLRSATRSPYSPSSYPEYDPSSPYSDQYSHPAIQSYSHGTAIAVIGSGGSEQRRTQTTPAGYGEVQMRQHSTARRNLFGRPTSSGRSSRTSARLVSYHQPYDPLEPMSTLEYSDLPNTPLAQSVTVYHQGFYNRLEQQQQQEQQRERPPQRPAERPYVATTNGVHRMEELDRGDDMAERPIRHFVDIRHSGSSRPHRIKRIVHEGREEYGKEIDPKDYAFMQQQWEFHPMHQTELAHELRPSNIRQHSNVYYQHTDEAGPSGMQQDDDLPRYRLIARQMPPAPPAPTEERKREREKEKKRRSGEHERRSDRGHITDSHVRAQIYQKEHTASTSIRRESPDSITRSRVSADVSSSSREGSRAAEQRTPMAAVPSPTTKEKKKKQRKRKHPKEASPQESPRRMRLIARIPPTQQSPEGQPSTSSLRFSLWKAARRTRQMDSTPEPTERYVGEMEEIGRQRELEQLDLLNRPAVSQMTPKSVSRRKTMSPIAPKRRKLIGRHRHEGEETVGSPDLSRYGYSTEPYIGHLPQFSRSSELDQSPFDSYVSSRHFEQMIASRDKPKRRAILYLGRTSSPGAAAADLHDEKREVRLIAKVLPQQKEEVASDTLKSRSKEGGTIGFMRKPKKTEKTTTREIGERYEGPLSQTTYSEDIGSLPLEGRPQQVSYSPVPGKVSLVTRKSSEEKEKRRAESPEKIAYPKSKHGYTFDTTPYEGPYESITYEEPLHKEHLPEFVDVYHVGVYEPAKVVEEKQRKSKEQSPEEEHKYSIGFWKKERRSHEAEEWPSSDPYTGALESTHRAHDLTKVELENRPAVVSMSPKTAHKPIPSPKASPKQAKYVLSTDPYLGDLETVRRSTDLEPSSLDSHVAVYKYEEKRTEGAKPKKKAILHIGKSTTPTDETYTEEPREVRLVARILPQQQEFDEPGKEVRDKSKERTSGLFKRGRKSQEPSPAIVAERYTGPVDDVHRENELSELPLAVHPSVSQMPMTSARKSKSTPSPASTTERRYKLWTRVKHEGVEDEVPKERIQITAYNFPSDKYEGELYEFGRSGELEPSSIQEHVSTLPSESIYKAQKGDKRKAILHLKRPRTASPSAEEEQPRQVRLLARVIPPSEQIEEPKTAKIGKEKSPSRFAFVKSRKSTEAKTPEQVERYSGPIEQTSYGEFSGQPLDFQPAAVSYDIKASPKKDKVASPVSTEQRRFRYITRIRHPGDEDIVAKEHVKASAYDFSTAPYEGELYEFGRGSELPSSSIQEHVSSIPPESVYKIQKGGKKKAVLHLKEQRPTSTNALEEEPHQVRLLARVIPPSEQIEEPKTAKIGKEKSPSRFAFVKSRKSTEAKTPELGEHYSGPLEQTSYGEFSGQPLDFQPTAVSYDIKTSPIKSKAKIPSPVTTEERKYRFVTKIRRGEDEDITKKEHVKPSAYDFPTTPYEGELHQTGRIGDIPTEPLQEHVTLQRRISIESDDKKRSQMPLKPESEMFDDDHERFQMHVKSESETFDDDQERFTMDVMRRNVVEEPEPSVRLLARVASPSETEQVDEPKPSKIKKEKSPGRFGFMKPRRSAEVKTPELGEHYSGPLEQTSYGEFSGQPLDFQPTAVSYDIKTSPKKSKAKTTTPVDTEQRRFRYITRIRHGGDEDVVEKEHVKPSAYDFSTTSYEGPLDETTYSELSGTPLDIPTTSVISAKHPAERAASPESEQRRLRLIVRKKKEEEPEKKHITKERPLGASAYDFDHSVYSGPLDETNRVQDIDGHHLHEYVNIRDIPPMPGTLEKKQKKKAIFHLKSPTTTSETPAEEEPHRQVKKSPVVTSAYDFDRSPYSGQLDEINPLPEMTGSQIREYVNIQDIPSPGDDRKKKAVLHLKRTPSPSVPEQEEHRQVLKVKVQPQEPTEIEQPSPRSSLGFGRLLKKGSRRSTDIESPILSEPYTGPLEVTTRAEELGKVELEARPTVSYSPKKIEKERHQRSGYDFNTDVYEGPLLTTGRVSDIDSTPLSEHANIYHSGIYESPKMGLKEKALRAVTPSKGSSEWEGFEEEPREVRVIARVRHEEEQPIDEEQRTGSATGHRFGFFKTKHEHEASPQELGERYTGPLDQTTYNELSGQPLEVTTYSPKVSPMASPKSAASPSDSEKRRFRLIGVHKEVRGKSETSQYSFSTEPYQGELGSVNYSADIDSQPLDQFVEKREYDYKITKSPKISKTPKTPVEEEKRPIRAKILVRPQDEETETSTSKPSTGFAFLSKKRGHKKEPYNPVLSTATTEVGETQRSGDLEKLPFDISTVSPVHEKTEHEKPTPSDSEQRRLRLIVRKKKEEGEEPVHEQEEGHFPSQVTNNDF
ncbi:hypothetical protein WR25_25264 isoform K [Diploscapter pachys]|nr:hypothetical protein WR25_25264 isoform G [Diploscapter pachys]PAV58126.1 hypothetical protein WR25_25264 isoform K [Diploscapter pachys]